MFKTHGVANFYQEARRRREREGNKTAEHRRAGQAGIRSATEHGALPTRLCSVNPIHAAA